MWNLTQIHTDFDKSDNLTFFRIFICATFPYMKGQANSHVTWKHHSASWTEKVCMWHDVLKSKSPIYSQFKVNSKLLKNRSSIIVQHWVTYIKSAVSLMPDDWYDIKSTSSRAYYFCHCRILPSVHDRQGGIVCGQQTNDSIQANEADFQFEDDKCRFTVSMNSYDEHLCLTPVFSNYEAQRLVRILY